MNKILGFIFLFCLITSTLFAQNKITGKVTSADNSPLPGVTILEKGTTNGTVSGGDGTYSFNVSTNATTLVFSFIGMERQEVSIDGKTIINVVMKDDSYALDEVVAVGYGTVKKSDLTGSVAQVKVSDLEQRTISSPEQLLQGTTSGVLVRTNSGAPGSGVDVQIRGVNSLSSSFSPLYIIDGIEMNTSDAFFSQEGGQYESTPPPSPLSLINPNDIESIEILKDASATAIYGSRAANGVIIVSTKSGKKGKDIISYNVSLAVSELPKPYDMLDTRTYMMFYDESLVNDGLDPLYGDPSLESSYDKYDYNINWQSLAYRTALSQNHNLTFSGADDRTKYSVIANYTNNEGIIITSFMKRFSVRSNVEREIKKGFKVGSNIFLSNTDSKQVQQSTGSSSGVYSPVGQIIQYRPSDPAWAGVDGNDLADDDDAAKFNPVTLLTDLKDVQNVKLAQARIYGDVDIADWLSFRSSVAVNYSNSVRKRHWPLSTQFGAQYNGRVRINTIVNYDYLNENYFTIKKEFGKNRINAVVGASVHEWTRQSTVNEGTGFDTDILGFESLASAAIIATPSLSNYSWSLASFYGRVNYSYDRKYLLTFTSRYDGSSRLGTGNKWDFFPSGAIAWRVTEEDFMQDISTISNLKLRASYGFTGNQSVPVFMTKSVMGNNTYAINNQVSTGFYSAVLANPNLKWERTGQMDIGFDLGLFDNRLSLTADYYKKNTTDMLFSINLPITSGYSSWVKNAGEIENKGWEFSAEGRIIEKKDLTWNMGINLSANKTKILELVEGLDELYGAVVGTGASGVALNDSPNRTVIGGPIGLFYGYETAGVYQNEEQAAEGPLTNGLQPVPGDIIFVDQEVAVEDAEGNVTYEKNGSIGQEDKVVLGDPNPDLVFGLNTNLKYKGFNLNVIFNGMLGNDVMNVNLNTIESLGSLGNTNMTRKAYEGRWTGEGTSNYYPRATNSNASTGLYIDRWVEDGSFLRLQSVTLSYQFNLKKNSIFESISPSVSASNLFVLTKYSGYDPEVQGKPGNPLTPGVDLGTYPLARTFKFGLNVSF
uniref:SusC/RagA family TonB-linked outer membrane protein n=1 Tax=uncultured Draconibacterium sp. TaxID=1573823 RepID=UPI003217CD16